MIDLSFRNLARVQRFTDFRELEAQVGCRLANNALKQLDGWALVSDGVITLKGYGVYLDLESINTDFQVSAKKSRPSRKARSELKSKYQSDLTSWELCNRLRAESQKRLQYAQKLFREYGILLVQVDLGKFAPRAEAQPQAFGSIH